MHKEDMRLIFFKIAFFFVTLAIVFVACSRKNEPEQFVEVAKSNDAAVRPNNQEKACVPRPDNFPEPDQTNATVGACERTDPDSYIEKTVYHLKNVALLMRENISDCRIVLIEVSKYIEDNKIDIENAIKAGDEAQSRMSGEEKKRVALRAKELFNPIMQDVGSISAEFAKKCRSDVKKLSELLKTLDGQASGL
jgi:hypothetical protein